MQATTKAGIATAAGVGTGDSPTFTAATLSGGTLTGGAAGLTLAAGGTNQNITLTPSGTGGVRVPSGSYIGTGAGSLYAFYLSTGSTEINGPGAFGGISFTIAGAKKAGLDYLGVFTLGSSGDTGLARASAGVVEINNGTAGTLRDLALREMTASAGVNAVTVRSAGSVLFGTGAAYGAVLYSPSDGVVRLTNYNGAAQNDFNRLQFGGTTSSFPSLKRSGTGLIVRLADDSADAPLTVSTIRLAAYTVATLPTPAAGMRAYVTDSNAVSLTAGIGAVVAAGGSTVVPVFYDGTNWRIA